MLESMLYSWQRRVEVDAPTLNITGDILQSQAIKFKEIMLQNFDNNIDATVKSRLLKLTASNGWLQNYLKRHSVRSHRRCGEHSSADTILIEKTIARNSADAE
uniref:HTH CENPB-type domain-containing protein n=1 Tax=Spongospora subterranea TaxID=70186 RepID=A0A0H5QJ17_9EUKA|eukprot:CRZ02008.1 hypothetical protein [Spongospora subterranea]